MGKNWCLLTQTLTITSTASITSWHLTPWARHQYKYGFSVLIVLDKNDDTFQE